MVTTNYSLKNIDSHSAKAYGRSLGISTKAAINIASVLRNMPARKAIEFLQNVVLKKQAVPYSRFTDGVGHRKGPMASGRYPGKAAREIGKVLASAIANASAKGLDDENLKIVHIVAHKGASQMHQGRHLRRAMKQTHVEIVVREMESSTKKKSSSSTNSKKAAPSKKKTASTSSTSNSSQQSSSSSDDKKSNEVSQ